MVRARSLLPASPDLFARLVFAAATRRDRAESDLCRRVSGQARLSRAGRARRRRTGFAVGHASSSDTRRNPARSTCLTGIHFKRSYGADRIPRSRYFGIAIFKGCAESAPSAISFGNEWPGGPREQTARDCRRRRVGVQNDLSEVHARRISIWIWRRADLESSEATRGGERTGRHHQRKVGERGRPAAKP